MLLLERITHHLHFSFPILFPVSKTILYKCCSMLGQPHLLFFIWQCEDIKAQLIKNACVLNLRVNKENEGAVLPQKQVFCFEQFKKLPTNTLKVPGYKMVDCFIQQQSNKNIPGDSIIKPKHISLNPFLPNLYNRLDKSKDALNRKLHFLCRSTE